MKARSVRIAAVILAAAACNAVLGNEAGELVEPPDALDAAPEAGALADSSAPAPDATDESLAGEASDCPSGKKRCGGLCVAVDDPEFGCAGASCEPCAIARGEASCAGLRCAIASCDPGFADCDQNAANGCETDLSAPVHCGACNAQCAASAPYCAPQGATFGCTTGCSAEAPTLCGTQCVDVQTSVTHCGGCNTVCPDVRNGQEWCSSARCGFTCSNGFHACGQTCLSDVNPLSCGASCTACPAPPNGTATCDGKACGVRCNRDFANCDENAGNGCEVNTTNDPANCGGCGKPCGAGSTCQAGACTPVDSGPPGDASSG